jgi:hypothetical protein
MALMSGLGCTDNTLPEGVLNGLSLGVFRAGRRGVLSPSSSRVAVAIRDRGSLDAIVAASGKERSSSNGDISWGFERFGEKLGDCGSRIKDAGVAGQTPCDIPLEV